MRIAKSFIPVVLFLLLSILSCKKDHNIVDIPENNQWTLDSMKVYYYWADQLPQHPQSNSSATDFFKSLLNPADRFSYMDDPDRPSTEYSSFAYYGFEYAFFESAAFPNRLLGIITLVVPGGPAAKKGLKRGDVFESVNDIELTNVTANQIKSILKQGAAITLQTSKIVNNQLVKSNTLAISYSYFREQPTYITKLFSTGTKKTGYIFYNGFNEEFDRNILDSITKFKSKGISDLILDLRYNPGGSVASAAKIAVAIAPVQPGQTFVINQANKNGGQIVDSYAQSIAKSGSAPNSFTSIKNGGLSIERLIVLTTSSTASAAELIINNLKPYLPVIQIGETTVGKDMASFEIFDQRKPKKINYILHPLIFKLYNANLQGNYDRGLVPDYKVDEFSAMPLVDFGNQNDLLLKKALEVSLGTNSNISSSRLAIASTPITGNGHAVFQSSVARSINAAPILIGHEEMRTHFK